MTLPPRLAALLGVPLLALLWGLNWPAVRVVLSWWSPWALRTAGMGAGALMLFALARARGEVLRVPVGQGPRLLVSALFTIVGFNLCTAFAQLGGSTSRAAIVTFTMPVWAVLFAWFVLGERPDRWRLGAIALGASGLALLGAPLLAAGVSSRGPLFALGAGLSWAAGTVFLKRFPIAMPPVAGTAWQLALGAAVCSLGLLVEGPGASLPASTAQGSGVVVHGTGAFVYGTSAFVTALLFHVVLATALAYLIWFDIVARLPAGVAALGTLLIPVVGVAGAMTLLHERPSAADLGGFALIIGAAALALLAPRGEETRAR